MNAINEFLRQTMGLKIEALGPSLVEQTIAARMRLHNLADSMVYLKLLRESKEEFAALLESLVVTETWFFRDREPFRVIARAAINDWSPAHPIGTMRILCVPCSTGEEPYSIAMALIDAGFPETRFQIDAMDARSTAIAIAERAEYGKNSFRGKNFSYRARHFKPVGKLHRLNDNVRSKVQFQVVNLLEDSFPQTVATYDFIFCRNLLIYFDSEAQKQTLHKLEKGLSRDGMLFVGSAELPIVTNHGFVPAKLPLGFACRRPGAQKSQSVPRRASKITTQPQTTPQPAAQPLPDLSNAWQLADSGRLREAAEVCERYLSEGGVCADVYYLLGLARDAAGAKSQAGEFYRKALYLEPNHYETLLKWSELERKNGDKARAEILHGRAERIKNGT